MPNWEGGHSGNFPTDNTMSITAKTKKTQCQRLLAYLRKNRKGITTMEAFQHLGITCVHKRIADIEAIGTWEPDPYDPICESFIQSHTITRTPERTATGSTVTRYKLAR